MDNAVDGLIADIEQIWICLLQMCAAIDLAGRNVFEAARMKSDTKIIETPWISAVADMALK